MKMFRMLAVPMLGAALCLGFTACSDDDDENGNGGGSGESTATVVKPSQVFTGGLPKTVSGMTISQNAEGLVTSITTEDGDKAVFEYFPATTKAEAAKDRAKITVTDEDGDVTELNLQLNSNGYVESCNSTDHAGTPDAEDFTWKMEYDAKGHLVVMERSESNGEITNITYNEDGDAVETSTRYLSNDDTNGDGVIDENDEWKYRATIDYTTDETATPIENKGCLMLFYETLDVDLDEMIYAYYAGMLGTATKHLPLMQHYTWDSQGSIADKSFTWNLNADGYPTELTILQIEWGDSEKFTFAW